MNGTQQTETTVRSAQVRKVYRRPQLVEYGRVSDMTQGGGAPNTFEDSTYFVSGT